MAEGSIPLERLKKEEHDAPVILHLATSAPEGLFTSHPAAPRCLLALSVVLLALTAQVFRTYIFATPVVYGPDRSLLYPIRTGCNATAPQCQTPAPPSTICQFLPVNDGAPCDQVRTCSFGACLLPTDPDFGKVCYTPVDPRCAVNNVGWLVDGQCTYNTYPDFTPCDPEDESSNNLNNSIIYRGWTCQNAVCTAPIVTQAANQAYQWSINAGLLGAALALETILTSSVSPDLAFLALNVGIILIGWDGFFQDVGLEVTNGLGRSQLALGFVVGGVIFAFAVYSVTQIVKREKLEVQRSVLAVALMIPHGVTLGLVATAYFQTFTQFADAEIVDQFSIVSNFAFPASIFAAAVAIAVSSSVLFTGSHTLGFSALTFVTGVIELAWTSTQYDQGRNTRDDDNKHDFTATTKAWESWAIIAAFFSILIGLIFSVQHSSPRVEKPVANAHRGMAIPIVIVFWTAIGLTASLFQNYYFDRSWSVYGNEMRVIGGHNFGNQMSGFAWEHSIWSAAIASSFGIELLKHGVGTGIAALALTTSANLVGWAAAHQYIGSAIPGTEELRGRTRAWEALCLISALFAFIIAFLTLQSREDKSRDSHPMPAHTDGP